MQSRKSPAERRQLLKEVARLYEKVEKTTLKVQMGMFYIGLRRTGDTHKEACRHVAKIFKKGISTVEHCIAPTRRALSQRALSEKYPSVAEALNAVAKAGKRETRPKRKLIAYAGKEYRRPRKIVKNERKFLQQQV
jgi:hypothetical protein